MAGVVAINNTLPVIQTGAFQRDMAKRSHPEVTSSLSHAASVESPRSHLKIEDEDEDMSSGPDSTLRSLQYGSEARDSPNSSLTSASMASSVHDVKSTTVPSTSPKAETDEHGRTYLYAKLSSTLRSKSSIPTRLGPAEYARQCVAAAEASRLNPYSLHEDEQKQLQDKLCQQHVSVYLNIRNAILRLWTRNPSVSVNLEEAVGCTRDERWTRLACFAWEWLVRKGYINFGCVDSPPVTKSNKGKKRDSHRQTIVVIGGGMAGLSTARQLTNLFQHYPDNPMPRIIVLEGRHRVGGRIYSHPLTSMQSTKLTPDQRPTAEMGAHIIVGFERGNPLDAIIRGQLALNYHLLRDLSTLYDVDGTPVNGASDAMIERLYNDILDRTGHYRLKNTMKKTAQGDKEYIDSGRDPSDDGSPLTIRQFEEATASGTIDQLITKKSRRRGAGHRAAKGDKSKEMVDTNMETKMQLPAAQAAHEFGFKLRPTTQMHETLDLDQLAAETNQSLGLVMNEGVKQYQKFLDLRPLALRLINWHFANLEYANAAVVDKLSLRGWDQDIGHEFEGEHSQIIGGYQQLPRALWRHPTPLDVRTNKVVKTIKYSAAGTKGKATVICEDGESIEADRVVFSAPLGVLKAQSINFDPPLPQWKRDAVRRMGFGLLNKVVLVFERPFWDVERDMFGLLREPRSGNGYAQDDYRQGRGQFYLFWNCIETSGLPVLIALMAGDAAFEAERTPDNVLVGQCVTQLRSIFGRMNVPDPVETIVTRWGSDRFARGTYSFVAKEARPADYDMLAESVSNLFFAGEATCGTHPATVHGAYLSGLRAANEVFESMTGPINVPAELVPPPSHRHSSSTIAPSSIVDVTQNEANTNQINKRKGESIIPAGTFTRPMKEKDTALQEAWDAAMWVRIYDDLGPPPTRPPKQNVNAFLLYQMEHWDMIKAQLNADSGTNSSRRSGKQKHERDHIRVELGKMWNALDEAAQKPYKDKVEANRLENERAMGEWAIKAAEWDRRTWEVKDVWIKEGNSFVEFCDMMKREAEGVNGDPAKKVKQ